MLSAPPTEYFNLGVDRFLAGRARSASKPISGLESVKEHNRVFEGLTDRESEMVLLLFFINAGREDGGGASMIANWRRGDVDLVANRMRESYRDFPAFYQRLIIARNQNWIPKIDVRRRDRLLSIDDGQRSRVRIRDASNQDRILCRPSL